MKILNWWRGLKRKFTKAHFNLMKVAWASEAFDSGDLLDIEKAKLQEMSEYFQKSQIAVGEDQWVRDINICIGLIDIITEETELINFDGLLDDQVSIIKSAERLVQMRKSGDHSYLTRPVNLKNIKYWMPDATEEQLRFYREFPDEFYKIKAEKLYYKIRQEKTKMWWD